MSSSSSVFIYFFHRCLTRLSGKRCSLRFPSVWFLSKSRFMAPPSFFAAVSLWPNSLYSFLWTAATTNGLRRWRYVSHCLCLSSFLFVFFSLCAGREKYFTHTTHKYAHHWIVHQSVLQEMTAESSDSPIWLTASRAHCGVVGMVNCLRQEPGGNRIRWEYIESRLKSSDK